MTPFPANRLLFSARNILCLGAHCDDIEIGCGGTILRLQETSNPLNFHWIVFSSNAQRSREAKISAGTFLKNKKQSKVVVKNFRNGYFPYVGGEIKDYFEELKKKVDPDLIFTHFRHDLHQDHRVISELTWNTFRNHLILEYEIPKYDGDISSPNVFVPLDEETCHRKIDKIIGAYVSQREKNWFTGDLLLSLLRLRGMEAGGNSRHAESFHCRKLIVK